MIRVMGVDACAAGWVGIVIEEPGTSVEAVFGTTLVGMVERAGPVDYTVVDMPIGLPDTTAREADRLGRAMAGSSVFITPVRAAFAEADHAAATAVNRELTGGGVSAQAYALRPKLLEVDAWVRGGTAGEVVEGHPEISFRCLLGERVAVGKKTWAGAAQRRALLTGAGIVLADDLGEAGRRAGVDDVLDAAVLAWTARRVAAGEAARFPDPPEVFSDGLPAAIWA